MNWGYLDTVDVALVSFSFWERFNPMVYAVKNTNRTKLASIGSLLPGSISKPTGTSFRADLVPSGVDFVLSGLTNRNRALGGFAEVSAVGGLLDIANNRSSITSDFNYSADRKPPGSN